MPDTAAAKATSLGEAMNWIDGHGWIQENTPISFAPTAGEEIGAFADANHADVAAAIQAAVEGTLNHAIMWSRMVWIMRSTTAGRVATQKSL